MKAVGASFLGFVLGCVPLAGCGSSEAQGSYPAHGVVQKGPFNVGATIRIQELDSGLDPTGRSFSTETTNNFGSFELPVRVGSALVEITGEGYYYDEVVGIPSSSPLTLRAYSDLRTNSVVNVNVLTDLEGPRLAYLTNEGASFAEADAQARAEVLRVFNIEDETGSFDDMNIALEGRDNAVLLAVSVVMQQVARSHADSSATVVAELSGRLAAIGSDLELDGELDDAGLEQDLLDAGVVLDLAAARGSLEARFEELGAGTVPAFEDYVDSDADGLLTRDDYSLAFRTESTTELATEVTSEEIELHIVDGTTQTAAVSRGTIVLNGIDTGVVTAAVEDGDVLAVKLASAEQYLDVVTPVTADVTVGKNRGSFTVETRFTPKATLFRRVPGDHLGQGIAFAGADVVGLGMMPLARDPSGGGSLLRFAGDDGVLRLEKQADYAQPGQTLHGPLVYHRGEVLVGTQVDGIASDDVFLLDATTGSLVQTFHNPLHTAATEYGTAYAVTDDLVAVSDPSLADGRVYLFDRTSGMLVRTLYSDPSNSRGAFGRNLAFWGNDLVIADVERSSRRSVVEIRGIDGKLKRSLIDPLPHGCFGCSLAVAGGFILVGDPSFMTGDLTASGAVHIFDAATGARLRTLENPMPQGNALFGAELAAEGNDLLVGAPQQHSGGFDYAGTAFLIDLRTGRTRFTFPRPEPEATGMVPRYGGFAMAGGKIAIGARYASPAGVGEAGAIYIFDATQGVVP